MHNGLAFVENKLTKMPLNGKEIARFGALMLKKMQANLLIFPHQQLLHEGFLQTDVGKLYQAIPFEGLAKQIPTPKRAISGKGC